MEKGFTSREVEAFAAVMRHGTITKAADFLDISQPGVSKLLAGFEAKAGFQVFRRHRQRLIATPEAVSLFTEVERSLISVQQIFRVARDIRDMRSGRLNVGMLPAIGSSLGALVIADFLEQHPDLSVTLHVRATQTLLEWVGRGQVDIALGVTVETANPAVLRRQLPPVPIVCVMRKDHRLAQKEVVSIADIVSEKVVSLLPSDPLSMQISSICRANGLYLHPGVETNLASALLGLVSATGGVAVIDSFSAAIMPSPDLVAKPFRPRLTIGYSIYSQRGSVPSQVAEAFAEHTTAYLSRMVRTV